MAKPDRTTDGIHSSCPANWVCDDLFTLPRLHSAEEGIVEHAVLYLSGSDYSSFSFIFGIKSGTFIQVDLVYRLWTGNLTLFLRYSSENQPDSCVFQAFSGLETFIGRIYRLFG